MNIFYLARAPEQAAQMACDQHVVKMILETAQILSTALYLNGEWKTGMYKPTHEHHPCVLWAHEFAGNYAWLLDYGYELLHEYNYRYHKIHAARKVYHKLSYASMSKFGASIFTSPPQCMPDRYKHWNPVTAYRNYYIGEKSRFARWTVRPAPNWYKKRVISV